MAERALSAVLALSLAGPARAQMHEHGAPPEHPRAAEAESAAARLDEAREASGTSWQPEVLPHLAVHVPLGEARLLLHGSFSVGYDSQATRRGGDQFIGPGWFMAMLRLPAGPTSLSFRAMLSPDPFTVGGRGYPLLLQSGEAYHGAPLHDRQHPHDLAMELSAGWRLPVSSAVALALYLAAVGEPALGPTAVPHRASAASDPLAPIGHHWQDSTHISFGVVTAGVATRLARLEASAFNGREPDDRRTDLEAPHLDSWSARLSLAPHPTLALQASHGFLRSPEALTPDENVRRTTASATWAPGGGATAVTLIWGRNRESRHDDDSLLVEGNWDLDGRLALFGRGEWVEKIGAELVVPGIDPERRLSVFALSAGVLRSFEGYRGVAPGVGVRASMSFAPSALRPAYGPDPLLGLFVYVLLRPAGPARAPSHGH